MPDHYRVTLESGGVEYELYKNGDALEAHQVVKVTETVLHATAASAVIQIQQDSETLRVEYERGKAKE